MFDSRDRCLALALGVVAVFSSGCKAPIALAEVHPSGFQELVRGLPAGGERVELLIDGQTILRGAYVPPAPGGLLVLHFLESGGSVARGLGGRLGIMRELADLGFGSLMLDWSGVGVSAGVRANDNLRRDASIMWREAMRRVEGDQSRILIRSASLGTLAAAGLLERGAKPGGLIMIAPVRAETAPRNFAKERYGSFFGSMLTAATRPIVDVDLVHAIKIAECPLLVLQPNAGDIFVTPEEQDMIESSTRSVTTRFGGVPGEHVEVVLRSHSLLEMEQGFLDAWVPAIADVEARASILQSQMPGGAIPSRIGEQEVQRQLVEAIPLTRTQPAELVVAAALASERVRNGVRLLWLTEHPNGGLSGRFEGLDTGELVDVFSLRDPAGEIPIDLIASIRVPYTMLEIMGGSTLALDPRDLPAAAWAGGAGPAGCSWSSRMEIPWLGTQSYEFDHSRIWRALLERGLSSVDARRQMVRVLLFAYGYAHRLRQSSKGDWVLEFWDQGVWIPLDLATPPESFHPPTLKARG